MPTCSPTTRCTPRRGIPAGPRIGSAIRETPRRARPQRGRGDNLAPTGPRARRRHTAGADGQALVVRGGRLVRSSGAAEFLARIDTYRDQGPPPPEQRMSREEEIRAQTLPPSATSRSPPDRRRTARSLEAHRYVLVEIRWQSTPTAQRLPPGRRPRRARTWPRSASWRCLSLGCGELADAPARRARRRRRRGSPPGAPPRRCRGSAGRWAPGPASRRARSGPEWRRAVRRFPDVRVAQHRVVRCEGRAQREERHEGDPALAHSCRTGVEERSARLSGFCTHTIGVRSSARRSRSRVTLLRPMPPIRPSSRAWIMAAS